MYRMAFLVILFFVALSDANNTLPVPQIPECRSFHPVSPDLDSDRYFVVQTSSLNNLVTGYPSSVYITDVGNFNYPVTKKAITCVEVQVVAVVEALPSLPHTYVVGMAFVDDANNNLSSVKALGRQNMGGFANENTGFITVPVYNGEIRYRFYTINPASVYGVSLGLVAVATGYYTSN